ncbi:hypothetical protein E4K64_33420 [Bradyrhizobium frederickii]|uniref:Uncharacterized protein n=1 Tax=Bradyrhizobium frederickii TaxID=2560054 RepID=A0A4Y9NRT9_9BRAD|nr:hypothetical protein [Bradyrhizobium frederickii]TFV69433.1 hypothetical protein E4K64_33420 [Bradyrhizobium frederickii]
MAEAQLSRSELHRAAELRWRDVPPGIPAVLAEVFLNKLKAGSTVRKLTSGGRHGPPLVSLERFKRHCELDPRWAEEALRISDANGRLGKGAYLREKAHCVNGHSLAEHGRVARHKGWMTRQCRACEMMRYRRGGVIKPDVLEKVKARLAANDSLNSFTTSGRKGYLVKFSTLARYRRENAEFDRFVVERMKDSNSRGQLLRWQRFRNSVVREEQNDYYRIRAMLPATLPDRDDIVSMIFEDLLTGALKREDIKSPIRGYLSAHNHTFATKYRKFGDSPLLSLDEALFDDGSMTRGDNVSRGLWD